MRATYLLPVLVLAVSATNAAQIETVTYENGVKTEWSIVSIGKDGIMRIDDGGWGSSASASAAAAAGTSEIKVDYIKGPVRDTTIYDPNLGEIMSVEGKVCRVLSKDSAPPPGMGFMNSPEMGDHQKQMADAMAKANKEIAAAMAQMKQGGASQAEIDAMDQLVGGLMSAGEQPTDDELEVELLERNVRVGQFTADKYLAVTTGGTEKYHFYMADIGTVPGGKPVKKGVLGMVNTMAEYMAGMGVDKLMNEATLKIMTGPQFENDYPVVIEDLQRNHRTEVTGASNQLAADVDFAPDCEKRDMMEF